MIRILWVFLLATPILLAALSARDLAALENLDECVMGEADLSKLDPMLANELAQQDASQESRPLSVIIQLSQRLSDVNRQELSNLGVDVGTSTGTIITSRGNAKAIKAASACPFVRRIERGKAQLY